MTTLASRLKQKLDQEKAKSPVKRPANDVTSDDSGNAGAVEEKLQKLEDPEAADKSLEDNNADQPHSSQEEKSEKIRDKTDKTNADKMSLEDWKLEKERARIKALETDRANIRKRMPKEVKKELRTLENQCKTGKPPTTANFKIFTNDVLIDLLRYNDRTSGNATRKPDLAAAVCDSMVNGTPPRCPKCKNSMLRFSCGKKKYGKRYYWCPGYMSGFKYYGCGFKANREDITRSPWIAPK